jgi:hypothetical protein
VLGALASDDDEVERVNIELGERIARIEAAVPAAVLHAGGYNTAGRMHENENVTS